MSVAASFEYVQRPFAATLLPGDPGGLWAVYGEVDQDESGGTRTLTHPFQVLPGISNSNYYNIEQINAHDSSGNSVMQIETTGMDAIYPTQTAAAASVFRRLNLFDISETGPQVFADVINQNQWRPWFLGQPSRNPSLSALLIASIDNEALNPGTLRIRIQGYWWPAGAQNAPGGLKRPQGSLYGA